MALEYTDISAYVNDWIVGRCVDVWFRRSPVLTRFLTKHRETFPGGKTITHPITINELWCEAVGPGEAINVDFVKTEDKLQDTMKVYACNITIYGFDAMLDMGPQAVFDQVRLKFNDATMTMAKRIATHMYLDNTANARQITGFRQYVDDGNTFPTIAGQTRSSIMAVGTVGGLNAYTATLPNFSLTAVNRGYGAAVNGPDHPDLIPATQNAWNLFWESLQPLQQYQIQAGSPDITDVGHRAFRFNNADVVVDNYMPTGTNGAMYLLNTEYCTLFISGNKKFNFGFTGLKELPNTLYDASGQFAVGIQLMVTNPRMCAKLLSTEF